MEAKLPLSGSKTAQPSEVYRDGLHASLDYTEDVVARAYAPPRFLPASTHLIVTSGKHHHHQITRLELRYRLADPQATRGSTGTESDEVQLESLDHKSEGASAQAQKSALSHHPSALVFLIIFPPSAHPPQP